MRFKRAAVGCLLLMLGALAVAGCGTAEDTGEGEETTAATTEGAVVETIEIVETDFALDPAEVTVDRAGTYVFVARNEAQSVHALEIEGHGIEAETENIQPGQSAELRVNLEPGTYVMYCPVGNHREMGMEGEVIVEQ